MKKILITLIVLLFTIPVTAQAHTVLSSSNPEEGQNITEPLEEVLLVFETQIEPGSTMSLKTDGQTIPFEKIEASGNTLQGMLAEQDLPNGSYVIEWSIVGADGHPIKGEVPFTMELEKAIAEPVIDEQATAENTAVDMAAPTKEAEQAASPVQEEPLGNSTMVTVLIAVLAIAIIAMAIGVFKKKKTQN